MSPIYNSALIHYIISQQSVTCLLVYIHVSYPVPFNSALLPDVDPPDVLHYQPTFHYMNCTPYSPTTVAMHTSNSIIKFADDTIVVDLITNNNEREEM